MLPSDPLWDLKPFIPLSAQWFLAAKASPSFHTNSGSTQFALFLTVGVSGVLSGSLVGASTGGLSGSLFVYVLSPLHSSIQASIFLMTMLKLS